ncbi:MAG: 2-phospho-L-lactate transferase [Acidobacteriota bacterium]|nr:2-phospho-L-lactate transferase [Acidobacteriota bacterium]
MTRIVALSGGVGGAKLALGLSRVVARHELMVVANTADDFEHLGLHISPDLDTVMYTLSGKSNQEMGWGREGESWAFLESLEEVGGETWFRLGDRDLAIHVERTQHLRAGESLSAVTRHLCDRLGADIDLVPMTDDAVRTIVETAGGDLAFQHYFVRDRCEPEVSGFRFEGIDAATASPGFLEALASDDLEAVVVCPSNPFVSVDPILALAGVREALKQAAAPVVAVSPIVAGLALKGPAAKMMRELDIPATALAVAGHYAARGLVDGFVVDETDRTLAPEVEKLGVQVLVAQTVMESLADRESLAGEVVAFASQIRADR